MPELVRWVAPFYPHPRRQTSTTTIERIPTWKKQNARPAPARFFWVGNAIIATVREISHCWERGLWPGAELSSGPCLGQSVGGPISIGAQDRSPPPPLSFGHILDPRGPILVVAGSQNLTINTYFDDVTKPLLFHCFFRDLKPYYFLFKLNPKRPNRSFWGPKTSLYAW